MLAIAAGACGSSSKSANPTSTTQSAAVQKGAASLINEGSKPRYGGSLVYGVEAETAGGYCLPQGQLAISGIMVTDAIYDTLTVPNAAGTDYVPYLAKSVTPNATYDEWTITLRPGIKFQNGEALDANALKLNLDSFRGLNPKLPPRLFYFVFQDMKDVTVKDPLTVVVTTKRSWPSLPSALYSTGRVGISAPEQLNNADTCPTKMIGTGPFKLDHYTPNQELVATRNPNYWRKGYPYLDKITFRVMSESAQRTIGLQSGQLDIIHSSTGVDITQLEKLADQGKINMTVAFKAAEVGFGLLNTAKAPFDDINGRKAVAYATNREEIKTLHNLNQFPVANGPFAPGQLGYVKDPGFPKYNLTKAKEFKKKYEDAHGGKFPTIGILSWSEPDTVKLAEQVKEQLKKAGINVEIEPADQATLITRGLGGSYQNLFFRNYPGGDPDGNYNWWYSTSPINFGRFKDPVIDKLPDEGRVTADRAKRKEIYEAINREFSKQAWASWTYLQGWAIAAQTNVHGVYGPDLPNGGKPFGILAGIHPSVGLWVSK
ncbi:MAG TPA: ABC transporter substrate-binding protein [Acidimicrobiia bacterium]|nr:ABC transporter substrate-binding protein [Acidimicrobiia bacterium]